MSVVENQDLFPDKSLLSASFIASLTDEELKTNLVAFKATMEEVKGTTAFFSASKNFENLYSEAKRRGLVFDIPIIEDIQKASLTRPYLPFLIYGALLSLLVGTIIYLKRRKK